MAKITTIMGGSDWYDASVNSVVLTGTVGVEDAHKAYRTWYSDVYRKSTGGVEHLSFYEWLIKNGFAREPTEDELEEFWDD